MGVIPWKIGVGIDHSNFTQMIIIYSIKDFENIILIGFVIVEIGSWRKGGGGNSKSYWEATVEKEG